MAMWNPWHGCHKISPGCAHCYVYRIDSLHGKDSANVVKNANFALPLRKKRDKSLALPSGETVYTCFSSDFFLEDADTWRPEAWAMIRQRADLDFFIVTKRIHRFPQCIPADWGDGYANVTICCTVENQAMAASRLPLFLQAPIRRKQIACEPLLEALDLSPWLSPALERVLVGGESGPDARICDFSWVLDIRRQCMNAGISFYFKQTGARFSKDGRLYRIPRAIQQSQARKAKLDT